MLFLRSKKTISGFDELNYRNVKKQTTALFKNLKKLNYEFFSSLIKHIGKGYLDDDWLDYYLATVDPVTKYIYTKELDRKQEYLTEALLSHEKSAKSLNADYKRAESLFIRMTDQVLIDLEDKATVEVMKKEGIKRVMWRTERDDIVCEYCAPLDGLIFNINDVPPKQHWNCRCWVEEVE